MPPVSGLTVTLNVYEEMSLKVVFTLLFNFILKFSAVRYLFIKGEEEDV